MPGKKKQTTRELLTDIGSKKKEEAGGTLATSQEKETAASVEIRDKRKKELGETPLPATD